MRGVYVYAIVAGEFRSDFGSIGLPDGDTRVTAVRVDGLSAIVSDYRGPDPTALARPELLRQLTIHQRAIEAVLTGSTLLPAKFATILRSRDQVSTLLDDFGACFRAVLARLTDVVEIEVAATWDLKQTFGEIGRQSEIATLAALAGSQSPDESLATRIHVGRLVKEAFDERRESYRQRLVDELAPVARDVHVNLTVADEIVFNVAFLVARLDLNDFYRAVHRLDEAFGRRLTFRCIGPLPPYSFASLEVHRPSWSEIDSARRALDLPRRVSLEQINTKYRVLATQFHPDHHPDDPDATRLFASIAAAHALLVAYVGGLTQRSAAIGASLEHDLTREAVERSLLVAIRGAGELTSVFEEARHELDAVLV